MMTTYGVVISDADAQAQLLALVRGMFPSATALRADGNEVGSSITPTSGQNKIYEK